MIDDRCENNRFLLIVFFCNETRKVILIYDKSLDYSLITISLFVSFFVEYNYHGSCLSIIKKLSICKIIVM